MTADYRIKIATLAENLVLASPTDPPALAALHLEFKEIGESWHGDGERETAAVCTWAMQLLEQLVLGESADTTADLARISEAVTFLQALLVDGIPPAELRLPRGAAGHGTGAGPNGEAAEAEDATDPDPGLLADFVQESREHLENADIKLMTLETDPGDAESVNAVFRAFHTIKGVAGFLGLKALQAFAHETEDLLDKVRQGRLPLTSSVMDVIFASVDALKKRVEWFAAKGGAAYPAEAARAMSAVLVKVKAASEGRPTGDAPPELPAAARDMRLGDILVASGAATREAVGEALRGQEIAEGRPGDGSDEGPAGKPPLGEVLVKQSGASPRDVALALRSQKQANEGGGALVKETVKVEAERLDRLLDAIGELVIAESMIFQNAELKGRKSPVLTQQMAQLDKITRELQKMGTSLRMVPIRPIFQKMARLVRDLGRKGGKDVEFVASGEETELDKTVVDKIGDPLVHMVRNSVDHGIEPDAAARIEAGKPAQARVGLRAFQKGGSVCIQIHDDGRGLNREAILRKAREKGLLKDDGASLSDQEVWRFIFEAGFSTAAKVTEISGRGVGMDVVRRNIEELRGRIEIESRAGEGTTFSIWLPLTLAIIDGMIVRLGAERFVFPTLSILRIVPLIPDEIRTVEGRGEMLLLQEELVPILRLDGLIPGRETASGGDRGLVVIVETGGTKAGLRVDELLGQQQVVIKGLGETLNHVPGLAGGAILSDGTVGLILDTDGLIRNLRAEPAAV